MLFLVLGLPALALGAVFFAAEIWQHMIAVPGQWHEAWNQVFAMFFLGVGAALVCTAWWVLRPKDMESNLESPRYVRYVGVVG